MSEFYTQTLKLISYFCEMNKSQVIQPSNQTGEVNRMIADIMQSGQKLNVEMSYLQELSTGYFTSAPPKASNP